MDSDSAIIVYLTVEDARRAIDWYGKVFGAEPAYDPIVMPDGRVGHAEVRIGSATIYLSDPHPEIGVVVPRDGEFTHSLMMAVDDADQSLATFEANGGRRDRDPQDGPAGRLVWVVDPFGHRWGLHSPLED